VVTDVGLSGKVITEEAQPVPFAIGTHPRPIEIGVPPSSTARGGAQVLEAGRFPPVVTTSGRMCGSSVADDHKCIRNDDAPARSDRGVKSPRHRRPEGRLVRDILYRLHIHAEAGSTWK
jgi:hypothetical protein